MSFPRYPAYKDSGVEWLGQVPEQWQVMTLRRCLLNHRQGYYTQASYVDDGVKLLRITDLGNYGEIDFAECPKVEDSPDLKPFLLERGDFVFARTGGAGTFGLVGVLNEPIAYASYLIRFRFASSVQTAFLRNFFLSFGFQEALKQNIHGGVNQNVHAEDIKDQSIAIPPIPEQAAIAAFLDRETAKIDALVLEQRRLIELLKEKRQAVISHAVTKGLNPDAPMKPSGIEWLGDVPAHWDVKPLKYLMSLTSGGTPSKENLAYWDGAVPWASSKDLKTDELFDTQDHITQKALDDGAAELVPPGSILTVVRGMILLHTFPVVITRAPMAINQDLKAILPTAGVDADFLAWLLRGGSDEVLSRTDEAGHGTKVLRMETWLAMQVPVPPSKEQALIVADIVKRLGELDALTAEAQRAIDLLQERRAALISAAVTGQIDVRTAIDCAAPKLENGR
ncbi:MAG: restriction endonuclease subunit S [Planctomycetes bacterium]|nr:restriction endonuclease subunit S [Planctomycetota bacterium]